MFKYKGYKLKLITTEEGLASHYRCYNDDRGRFFSIDVEEVGIDQELIKKKIDEADKKLDNQPSPSPKILIGLLDKTVAEDVAKFVRSEVSDEDFINKLKSYRTARVKLIQKFYAENSDQE